jgi:hypothetical protein
MFSRPTWDTRAVADMSSEEMAVHLERTCGSPSEPNRCGSRRGKKKKRGGETRRRREKPERRRTAGGEKKLRGGKLVRKRRRGRS